MKHSAATPRRLRQRRPQRRRGLHEFSRVLLPGGADDVVRRAGWIGLHHRLLALHSALYDQAYRYRRVMMTRFERPGELDDEHQALADLALARDGARAASRLAHHLASTLANVYPPTNKAKGERIHDEAAYRTRRRPAVGGARR